MQADDFHGFEFTRNIQGCISLGCDQAAGKLIWRKTTGLLTPAIALQPLLLGKTLGTG